MRRASVLLAFLWAGAASGQDMPLSQVLIDGETWRGPQGDERLLVQVPEGPHHVEIRKEGRRSFATDITVRSGETVPLNVSLSPGDRQ